MGLIENRLYPIINGNALQHPCQVWDSWFRQGMCVTCWVLWEKEVAGIEVVQFSVAEKAQLLTRRCDLPGRDQTQFLFLGH